MLHVYGLILETRFTQFFSSFLFVTALAAYTNAKLFHRLIFSSAVHIYVFSHPHFYIHPSFRGMSGTNSHNDQLPVGLIAQLVRALHQCRRVMDSNLVQASFFFQDRFSQLLYFRTQLQGFTSTKNFNN